METQQLRILWFAAPLVLLGYLYNSGPRPLSYTHLGEWVTGLCYGPGVFGCLWVLATGQVTGAALPGSLAFFTLAVALLLSHQPPQIETDRQAGKLSFAVRFGEQRTRQTARLLYLLFLLSFLAAVWQADITRTATGSCLVAALGSTLSTLFPVPSPRRILTGAMAVIFITLTVEMLVQVLQPT